MSKKITREEFIKRSVEKHGNKYTYEEVILITLRTNILIKCPEHGLFEQTPHNHLNGNGCQTCAKMSRTIKNANTKDIFIKKAKLKHGDKYDYSLVKYINSKTNVLIICPIHGEFYQLPSLHTSGCNCPKCSGKYNNTKYFIESSNKTHSNKYDYSKTKYIDAKTPVCIICKNHGEFWQLPSHHMNGCGCKICHSETPSKKLSNNEEFIKKANLKHDNFYKYDKVLYNGSKHKVIITCPIHGDFSQTPFGHLQGCGCKKCAIERRIKLNTISKEDVIKRFIEKHGNKYDYSKIEYKGLDTKVMITCLEHGYFLQTPHSHWYGQGCPKCTESKLETEIRVLLENNNINYIYEEHFEWLGRQTLDFYLPEYNIAIECQGIQHFEPIKHFKGDIGFKAIKKMDLKKFKLCKENIIKLFYFANESPEEYLDKIYLDKNELLEEILKHPKIGK